MTNIRFAIVCSLFGLCACGGQVYVPTSQTQDQNIVSTPPAGSQPTTVNPNTVDANFPATGPTVRYVGRFDASNPNGVQYAWSGSSIITNFHGTGITAGL